MDKMDIIMFFLVLIIFGILVYRMAFNSTSKELDAELKCDVAAELQAEVYGLYLLQNEDFMREIILRVERDIKAQETEREIKLLKEGREKHETNESGTVRSF